jgi:hypothetical protein
LKGRRQGPTNQKKNREFIDSWKRQSWQTLKESSRLLSPIFQYLRNCNLRCPLYFWFFLTLFQYEIFFFRCIHLFATFFVTVMELRESSSRFRHESVKKTCRASSHQKTRSVRNVVKRRWRLK